MKAAKYLLVFAIIGLFGCTATQKGAGIGAAAGGGLGAVIGHQSGHTGEGALIGAGAGALAGALIGDAVDEKKTVTKFCPQCGRRFNDTDMVYCPYDGAQLKPVSDYK
ncbi:MAG: YMGG-like glycine zipper-containing protein [Candidatus Omnitrophica bacterium]|nr:YMGG-like glycine zipper-containing protein [Candidatus Omnitrophota bacterium]MDD5429196.1 YMGG-like glycine zipper-containing protein [Candidatus Omnitrophota bacterium]